MLGTIVGQLFVIYHLPEVGINSARYNTGILSTALSVTAVFNGVSILFPSCPEVPFAYYVGSLHAPAIHLVAHPGLCSARPWLAGNTYPLTRLNPHLCTYERRSPTYEMKKQAAP